jgi:hypothetical protein
VTDTTATFSPFLAPAPSAFPALESELQDPTLLNPPDLRSAVAAGLIWPGDILHVRSLTILGWAIRRAIGSWGNHDAILLFQDGRIVVGDATWPKCRCTPLEDYQRRFDRGTAQYFVLRPTAALHKAVSGHIAAVWWQQNVRRKWYDLGAYPRLIAKAIVGDLCQWPAGWEWAWYCTEGCRGAWQAAGLDPWAKTNPTPRTTEKRTLAGDFTCVWSPLSDFPLTTPKYTAPRNDSAASEALP